MAQSEFEATSGRRGRNTASVSKPLGTSEAIGAAQRYARTALARLAMAWTLTLPQNLLIMRLTALSHPETRPDITSFQSCTLGGRMLEKDGSSMTALTSSQRV